MSQDVPPTRERLAAPAPSDTQRLREIRERLKRLERELLTLPGRKRGAKSR